MIASRYAEADASELVDELRFKALLLKRKHQAIASDWRAYLAKALYNHASRHIARWRKEHARLTGLDDDIHPSLPDASSETDFADEIAFARRALSRRAFSFMVMLAECDGNISKLAREMKLHRNTVTARAKKIRAAIRCIRNWSKGRDERASAAAASATLDWQPRSRHDFLRQEIIIRLAEGHTYRGIRNALGVSQQTITTCRRRFEAHGPKALMNHSKGKQRSEQRQRLETWLRKNEGATAKPSALARRFGLHRTTVYRTLKNLRR